METSRHYVTIIITTISNITVLVSHSVTCFAYFMPMSHAFNKNNCLSPSPSPPLLSLTRFSPVLFVVSQEMLYQSFFFLIWSMRILQKNVFAKQNRFFVSTCCCSILMLLFCVYVFLRALFHSSVIMSLRIASCLHICIASYLVSHQTAIWQN